MSLDKKLDFWIKNSYNVLFRGKHGVGKTTMIIDAFNKAGLKWMYFSASTMDPWVDFIGVPKEVKDINGKSYLELIRPKQFQDDEVEALFFDEFNRAPKKVRNAVMELIQFKSINGKKFSKLKIVWAAINPDNDDTQKYDVEELDPAQLDRFHIHHNVPYAPHAQYFKDKYGVDLSDVAIQWWKDLPSDAKQDISPRRLDYALQIYKDGGDIRDVLPSTANINKLIVEINSGSITKKMKKLFDDKDTTEAKKFLTVENNFSACIDHIIKKNDYVHFFTPLMSDEKVSSLIGKHKNVEEYVVNNFDTFEVLLRDIAKANTNTKIAKRIKEVVKKKDVTRALQSNVKFLGTNGGINRYFTSAASVDFATQLTIMASGAYNTQQRLRNYDILNQHMPKAMTDAEAKKTLEYLSDILNHSHRTTIVNKLSNIIPMFNHVVSLLAENNITPPLNSQTLGNLKSYPDFVYNMSVAAQPAALVQQAAQAASPNQANPWQSYSQSYGPRNW